jgi:hypothetical protein
LGAELEGLMEEPSESFESSIEVVSDKQKSGNLPHYQNSGETFAINVYKVHRLLR